MEQIFETLSSLIMETENPIPLLTLLIAVFLFCKFVRYVFKNWTKIREWADRMYNRRRNQEELLQKINTSFEITARNSEAMKTMQENYMSYHDETIRIRNGLQESVDDLRHRNDTTIQSLENINTAISGITNALIEELNDKITQKCKAYVALKGIPEDEIEDFQRMFDVYKSIGGNHGLEVRFLKTKELPIIPKKKEE